jgi:phosphate transport system substrate-binding protein
VSDISWEFVLAVLGVAVPVVSTLWEFVFIRRKRLGYRVQLDTTAADGGRLYAGSWGRLEREDGTPLDDASFVLLRIENNGATPIDPHDYAVPLNEPAGLHVKFPGRSVAGLMITELSDPNLARFFGNGSGLGMRTQLESGRTVGVIDLPKVALNRRQHYKVLAALERAPDNADGEFADPQVIGTIKGGVGAGTIRRTRYRVGPSPRIIALVLFLVALNGLQLVANLNEDGAPLDCATGRLTLTGSTAVAPIMQEAADAYADTCPGAEFDYQFEGSGNGLRALAEAGSGNWTSMSMLAFSDGPAPDGLPELLPRPTAFSLFTAVVNEQAGVTDLTVDQVQRIYRGRVGNWSAVGGRDLPIRLVSREPSSGTRATFQRQVLGGIREPGSNSDDCVTLAPGAERGVVRCERPSTDEVLSTVAATPGALGYSELSAAADRDDLALVRLNGQAATLDAAVRNAYPFWQTEYAYTHGEPKPDSLTASFLRYLTNEAGRDIIRSHGLRPCTELANPVRCHP